MSLPTSATRRRSTNYEPTHQVPLYFNQVTPTLTLLQPHPNQVTPTLTLTRWLSNPDPSPNPEPNPNPKQVRPSPWPQPGNPNPNPNQVVI